MTAGEEIRPRSVPVNGTELAYLQVAPPVAGAPLVVVLHGFPDTAWSFVPLLRDLATAGLPAVAPFLRGYPPSAVPADGDYSYPTLGRDVIGLADRLGAGELHIVGHDWGAVAAYSAAALRPDRVGRVVAAAVPHPRHFLLRPTPRQVRASHYIFRFQLPGWAERRIPRDDFAWLRRLAQSWSPGWPLPDRYFDPVKDAFAEPVRLKAALAYFRALPRLLVDPAGRRLLSRRIQVPTRVIYGTADRCILPRAFRGCEPMFAAQYELIGMPGVGHFMNLEAPGDFAALVVEFLRR
jgi:pimeloyl-ACP methyl ester carboxylesterase